MALQEVKLARYKYQAVRYSHVPMDPAEPAVLTADPWSYLHGYLLEKISRSAGNNRLCFTRAKYFSSLAEEFYRASESAEMPAKGTLIYYGMMNLVKSLLATKKVSLEDVVEHHGVTNTHGRQYSLTVQGRIRNCTNIFLEFARLMGTPVRGKHEINVRHIFNYIPELHGIARSSGFVKKPKYLPVEIDFCVNHAATYLLTEVSFSKGQENVVDAKKFCKGKRKEYFLEPYEKGGTIVYRSKRRKKVNNENWPRVYRNILKEYSDLGFASILTRNGYKYYCSLQEGSYHHLCNSYLLLFYLGHTARYRPTEIQKVMDGELRPMATEAVAVVPKQFLYQLVGLITGKLCVIPFASI